MENYQKLPGKIMMISTDLSPKVIINNHFKCWWTKLFLNEQNVAYCGWGGGAVNKTRPIYMLLTETSELKTQTEC